MSVRIKQTDDLDLMRELDALAFPGCDFPGDDHTYWLARDESSRIVGYCSAVYRPDEGYVYFSRAAVTESMRGSHLQRRLIRTRIRWAHEQGADRCVTYTLYDNYPSIINLLRCGFRFYTPDYPYMGSSVHYFKFALR